VDIVSCLISEIVEPESNIASTNLPIVMFIIELLYLTAASVIILRWPKVGDAWRPDWASRCSFPASNLFQYGQLYHN